MPPDVVTAARPKFVTPRKSALDPGVERFVVRGGGAMVFALEAGDVLALALAEGGQAVEIAAFSAAGRDGLALFGLAGGGAPDAITAILAGSAEDAARVRSGLARRGLDLGRVRAARLFGDAAPAGATERLLAEAAATVVVAAPTGPGSVWEQGAPTDVVAEIRRARILPAGQFRLPEPLAEPRLDIVIDAASAVSFEVFAGEYIQIVDVAGRQCSDFLAFRRKALDRGLLRGIEATTTRTMTGTAYPKPGLHSKFFDQDRLPLVEVVQDTVGRHDTFNLACTARYYEDMGYFGHINCSDNFNGVLEPYGIDASRGWPAINFFFNTNVGADNVIWADEPWSRAGDYVLMRALDDLVCGTSSCPDDIDPANGWVLTPIHVRVYPAENLFKRAVGYRMTPDAPLELTRETGFHGRLAALTRSFTEYRGFWLPTCFAAGGPQAEYLACRERAAVMDLSPLRKLEILGPGAEDLLQGLMTRDVRRLTPGQVVYTAMCHAHGGMIDDGTLFRLGPSNFRWVGGDDAGVNWIKEQGALSGLDVHFRTATDSIHNIAVQGPKSREILAEIVWTPDGRPTVPELGWFRFTVGRIGGYDGTPVLVSRTGYTGELGYEVFCHPSDAGTVFDAVMAAGAPHGIAPLGLDALDMLRIEAGLVFAGFDFDASTDPFEAGIGFAVPAKKADDYVGKAALERRRAAPHRALVGLKLSVSEHIGHGDPVFVGRARIGVVTSATRSPHLGATIALARLDISHAALGTAVEVGRLDGYQKRLAAEVVAFPFYDPEKTRVRA
ncbi:DUF1989 domain-containing protein [Methylobrevis albus]|uniref:Aminomethyltransferase family protein n=1 Tax=Methylobrevis albus TaxID=2793297 RepID=A0A931MX28_9HYPH|nr:aminomethyltransferase family protein [Methylobrevis albus]MBH0236422.1 aminomethyltransferase family protein [Methylobrevis albus]